MHGYFKFEETLVGQISDFISIFGLDIVLNDKGIFTFPALAEAKDYSILGADYLGAAATKTYAGSPSDIMRENGFVYDFVEEEVVPIASISKAIAVTSSNRYFISNGLILPGSVTEDGDRVTDYSAWFYKEELLFRYTEIDFV